ncbi:MAG: hypothetical protein L6U99_12365 [Clostridium sp.]|nr:MAG: hypothetical protein L6U99_12365 [Clostridium sp.]
MMLKRFLDELKAMKDNADSFKEHELAYAKKIRLIRFKLRILMTLLIFELKVGDHVIIKKI